MATLTDQSSRTEEISPEEARGIAARLRAFATPSARRSIMQLSITAAVFCAIWAAMWLLAPHAYWLTLLLSVPAGAFLIRLFTIQHDCGHCAFFRSAKANHWVGRILGVFTLTPYDYWRQAHAAHHATSGNLDRRGVGDIAVMTVPEYQAAGRWQRFAYRFYRHPLVLLGIGPTYVFILKHRLPLDLPFRNRGVWLGILATNLGIAATMLALVLALGPVSLLKVHVPVLLAASSIGIWVFFVQHQYADAHWRHDDEWNVHVAALHGSSHYVLPLALRWLTGNIGLHHVHHLCSKVPNYRLQECVDQIPDLGRAKRLTLWESFSCMQFVLWDEKIRRMVRFRDAKKKA
jgi:omega-6 fatty acid desaturase (delta-12 desaturase)